eukprot:TRINITY_DN2863_c0_g1_i2.p1 TRINITY_DN2863_c0_g1~~TRINITY_DN2863_c0_g1_i2.p1  ORF type:complete len:416 (+),score=59.98 TRINITY_DN2863_c0_g1_i2:569-1816(+)
MPQVERTVGRREQQTDQHRPPERFETPCQPGRGTGHGAARKAEDHQQVQTHATAIDRHSAQPVTERQTKVGDDAGDMGGTDHCAAVGRHHGVLDTAGGRCPECGGRSVMIEAAQCGGEQGGFEDQADAVTAAELQGAVFQDRAAGSSTGEERQHHQQQMQCGGTVAARQFQAEPGHRAGDVGNRLMLEAQQADGIDAAGVEREYPGTPFDPGRQALRHGAAVSAQRSLPSMQLDIRRSASRLQLRLPYQLGTAHPARLGSAIERDHPRNRHQHPHGGGTADFGIARNAAAQHGLDQPPQLGDRRGLDREALVEMHHPHRPFREAPLADMTAMQGAEIAVALVLKDVADQIEQGLFLAFEHLHEMVADLHQHAGDGLGFVAMREAGGHHVEFSHVAGLQRAAHVDPGEKHDCRPCR